MQHKTFGIDLLHKNVQCKIKKRNIMNFTLCLNYIDIGYFRKLT